MKAFPILVLVSAAALPQLSSADIADTNPAGLGEVHALLDFCIRHDPKDAASFQAEWQSIVGNESGVLAKVEQNSVYKQKYAAFTSELEKLPPGETSRICAVSAVAWNGSAHEKDDGGDGHDPKDGPRASHGAEHGREDGGDGKDSKDRPRPVRQPEVDRDR